MQQRFPVGRDVLIARMVVVGIDTVDASPCLMLVCDDKSYMFNCGEGTQRLCEEYKIKLPKLGNMFFTKLDWKVLGGFPGMLLTMSDIGGERLDIVGPPGTLNFLSSLRYFVRRPDLALHVNQSQLVYSDDNLTVTPVLIRSAQDTKIDPIVQDYPEVECNGGWISPLPDGTFDMGLGKKKKGGDSAQAKAQKQAKKMLPPEDFAKDVPEESRPMKRLVSEGTARSVVCCFVLKLADVRGKFDVQKAKALGIPPGKAYADLVKGLNVTAPDGRIVSPQDCLAPNVEGPICIIIDCPDESYQESLMTDVTLQHYLPMASIVYHMTQPAVFTSPLYSQWLQRHCASDVQHFALNQCCPQGPVYRSACAVQTALASVSPVFRVPLECPRVVPSCPPWAQTLNIGDAYVLAPAKQRGFEACSVRPPMGLRPPPPPSSSDSVADAFRDGEMEFGFLGTGASRPSKYRNVTSQYVCPGGGRGMLLLDCGEGTLGQLARVLGSPQLENALQSLSCICVSHLHADHHLGLTSLLVACSSYARSPLHVVCPAPLSFWAQEMREWHIPPKHGWTEQWHDCFSIPESLGPSVGLTLLRSVSVIHCPLSFGFVLEWANGPNPPFKLVYSGDTRPCERLEQAGQGCHLLIHEATFEDSMQTDAEGKRHCTISEAIESGRRMGCQHAVLTHFSQRYPKSVSEAGPAPVALAWDMMCFQQHHLHLLPNLSSIARTVFPEEED